MRNALAPVALVGLSTAVNVTEAPGASVVGSVGRAWRVNAGSPLA